MYYNTTHIYASGPELFEEIDSVNNNNAGKYKFEVITNSRSH
jgi:hypothetical protein